MGAGIVALPIGDHAGEPPSVLRPSHSKDWCGGLPPCPGGLKTRLPPLHPQNFTVPGPQQKAGTHSLDACMRVCVGSPFRQEVALE